jgi:2-polyprenyl-3-methyl-5-hydroxy-6-metoxy-1,4-benzoquinol methylase
MIDEYLIRMENYMKEIKSLLLELKNQNVYMSSSEDKLYLEEFDELKALLSSKEWPEAVEPDMICDQNNEEQVKIRAQGILDFMIEEPFAKKKFLDFGCGNGAMAEEALELGASSSVGYDVEKKWTDKERKVILTTSLDTVKQNGPYDIILLYDVLDHANTKPEEILKQVHSVCKPHGRVFVRCHPWCSRTATHAYTKVNKAFLHLVFSDIELVRLGIPSGDCTQRAIHPQMTYQRWFDKSGFKVISASPSTETVENFFKENPIISKRIKSHWMTSHDSNLANGSHFPEFQLKMQFIDYSISPI